MCFHLDLIGAGDGLEETQSLTRELGLEGVVTFWGRLSAQDYSPILADADIGLSPYCGWQEFSGLKLFDYKAAGLASIASGKDNQPHTLTHGSTGWIVPPCDEEALADAIRYLTANSELRRQIGRAARLEAERMHTWTHTAEKIEEILERFVNL
jgi:glycosyltransferase involved in cell wall biosynthesis